jgi:hypothetical protein
MGFICQLYLVISISGYFPDIQGLCTKHEYEMFQMEYWQKLVNLNTSKQLFYL